MSRGRVHYSKRRCPPRPAPSHSGPSAAAAGALPLLFALWQTHRRRPALSEFGFKFIENSMLLVERHSQAPAKGWRFRAALHPFVALANRYDCDALWQPQRSVCVLAGSL